MLNIVNGERGDRTRETGRIHVSVYQDSGTSYTRKNKGEKSREAFRVPPATLSLITHNSLRFRAKFSHA